MPTKQLFLFFILIFLALPTLRAAVPLSPTATTVSISQSPPIEPIIKKTKKIKKRPNQKHFSERIADATFVVSTILFIGLAVTLVLGLVAVLPWAWVLWSSLSMLFLAILAPIIVIASQSWAALLVFVMVPLHIFLFGLAMLIGGLIASIFWAWLTGALVLLLLLGFIPLYRKIL